MTFLANFDIRFTEMEDLTFLRQWFADESSLDDFPFGSDDKDEALKNWIGFSKFKASLTGTLHNVPCSIGTLFLMPYRKVAHHCSFYVIVDPQYRRKGIGFSMVKNLLHLAQTKFLLESVQAEVYEPSALIPLLQKLRFEIFARQENFVHIDSCQRPRVLLEHYFP